MYVNFLSTYSDKKSCHTSTTLQTSIVRFVSNSWASCVIMSEQCCWNTKVRFVHDKQLNMEHCELSSSSKDCINSRTKKSLFYNLRFESVLSCNRFDRIQCVLSTALLRVYLPHSRDQGSERRPVMYARVDSAVFTTPMNGWVSIVEASRRRWRVKRGR